jgi:hypothetical protein
MVDFRFPAVCRAELAFHAAPAEAAAESRAPAQSPAWTDHNTHDPGVTLVELHAYSIHELMHRGHLGLGVVEGLAVASRGGSDLALSPDLAIGPDGRAITPEVEARISRTPPSPDDDPN